MARKKLNKPRGRQTSVLRISRKPRQRLPVKVTRIAIPNKFRSTGVKQQLPNIRPRTLFSTGDTTADQTRKNMDILQEMAQYQTKALTRKQELEKTLSKFKKTSKEKELAEQLKNIKIPSNLSAIADPLERERYEKIKKLKNVVEEASGAKERKLEMLRLLNPQNPNLRAPATGFIKPTPFNQDDMARSYFNTHSNIPFPKPAEGNVMRMTYDLEHNEEGDRDNEGNEENESDEVKIAWENIKRFTDEFPRILYLIGVVSVLYVLPPFQALEMLVSEEEGENIPIYHYVKIYFKNIATNEIVPVCGNAESLYNFLIQKLFVDFPRRPEVIGRMPLSDEQKQDILSTGELLMRKYTGQYRGEVTNNNFIKIIISYLAVIHDFGPDEEEPMGDEGPGGEPLDLPPPPPDEPAPPLPDEPAPPPPVSEVDNGINTVRFVAAAEKSPVYKYILNLAYQLSYPLRVDQWLNDQNIPPAAVANQPIKLSEVRYVKDTIKPPKNFYIQDLLLDALGENLHELARHAFKDREEDFFRGGDQEITRFIGIMQHTVQSNTPPAEFRNWYQSLIQGLAGEYTRLIGPLQARKKPNPEETEETEEKDFGDAIHDLYLGEGSFKAPRLYQMVRPAVPLFMKAPPPDQQLDTQHEEYDKRKNFFKTRYEMMYGKTPSREKMEAAMPKNAEPLVINTPIITEDKRVLVPHFFSLPFYKTSLKTL